MKKKKLTARKAGAFMRLSAATLLLLGATNAKAQLVPAVNPDAPVDLHDEREKLCFPDVDAISATTVNCDMIDVPGTSGKKLTAVAADVINRMILNPNPAPPSYPMPCSQFLPPLQLVTVSYNFSTSLPWNFAAHEKDRVIPGATSDPDVVIGDNLTLGSSYYISPVVYTAGPEVQMTIFNLDSVGVSTTVTPTVSYPSAPITLNDVSNGRIASKPHIDLFGDPNANVGGYHALHEFIAVWQEYAPGSPGTYYIMAAIGDISNPSAFTRYQITPNAIADPEGVTPDVGAMGVTGACGTCDDKMAYITYLNPTTGDWMVTELSFMGSTLTSINHITHPTAITTIGVPRIEALALGKVTSGNATWRAVCSATGINPGTTVLRSWSDQGTSHIFPVGWTEQVFSPVVAGVGEDMDAGGAGKLGEIKFTIGYYSSYPTWATTTNGDFYAIPTPNTGSTIPINIMKAHQLNTTALVQSGPHTSYTTVPMAMSSSSNSGDGLFSVWYTGYKSGSTGQMFHKISGNSTPYFKNSTSVSETDNAEFELIAYPNPAQDILSVKLPAAPQKEVMVSIMDITGKMLIQTHTKETIADIDISSFAKGVYILKYKDEQREKTIKFVKE